MGCAVGGALGVFFADDALATLDVDGGDADAVDVAPAFVPKLVTRFVPEGD